MYATQDQVYDLGTLTDIRGKFKQFRSNKISSIGVLEKWSDRTVNIIGNVLHKDCNALHTMCKCSQVYPPLAAP